MKSQPQITVLGIHRIPVTDELVQGVSVSFGPPTPLTEKVVRSFLSGVVLVEVGVSHADADFGTYSIKQPSTSDMLRSLFDGLFLTPEGDELLAEVGDELPPGHDTFRVAMFLRDWNDDEPLLSCYGECDLPDFTPMPERLQRLEPYFDD